MKQLTTRWLPHMRVQVMNLYTKVLLLLSVLNCKPIYKVCMQGSGTWLTSLCSVCKFVLIYCSWGAGSEPWGTCVDGVSCLSGGCHSIICLFAHMFFYLLCLGGRSPEAYGGHHVCVCVCVFVCVCFRRKLSRAHSLHPLKIKHWNLQCKLNAILSWNEIGGF